MIKALHVVSLFAGAGGLSLGFSQVGLRPILAAEIDEDAISTYSASIGANAFFVDISNEPKRIETEVRKRIGADEIFAVIGGPPCQGFSTAGARDHDDFRNRLVFAYLELVRDLRPAWFLFENVEGLLTSGNGEALESLAIRFGELGYSLRIEKINFAGWGVPQSRKRVLIVGNRHRLHFRMPAPTHAFTGRKHRGNGEHEAPGVGEALAGLPRQVARSISELISYASPGPQSDYDAIMRNGDDKVAQHACVNFERDSGRIALLGPGQSLKDISPDFWPESYRSRAFRRVVDGMPTERRGGAPAGLRRLAADHVSLTITSQSSREFIHPVENRPLSLRECARLQGFPDTIHFSGNFQSVARQIGNAFPPPVARLFAQWLLDSDGAAGTMARPAPPGLIGFRLTEASGMSPVLATTYARLMRVMHPGANIIMPRRPTKPVQKGLTMRRTQSTRLDAETRRLITKIRTAKPVSLSDRELGRLISVALHDLGHHNLIPDWVGIPQNKSYYDIPFGWFTQDAERPFEFNRFFLDCKDKVQDFETILRCLCELHKRRRKYSFILENQPVPTMDQIARRGLLEHGTTALPGLTSWLIWRKWIYDIDGRSGQETGYLFEPILAASLGGESYSGNNSPVKRTEKTGARQVDCIVDADGERTAYEFKARVTIAASGQGRFAEELSFPEDCRNSGYRPILLVMDPTWNPRLEELAKAFERAGGTHYIGDAMWAHVEERSGPKIAHFVKKYVKEPILDISKYEEELLDLHLKYVSGPNSDSIVVSIGEQSWTIEPGPRRNEAPYIGEVDLTED